MGSRFGTSSNDANYGNGVVVLEAGEVAGDAHAEAICERLSLLFHSPGYTPPVLPAAAVEVHRLTQTKDVRVEQILSALEKDPLLAARILRVASSPVHGGQNVDSLQAAVMRVGLRTLADLVWEVALNMRVFRSKAYEGAMEAVRRHSIAVAHVARAIAKLTPVPLEYAFLCGLLHDVGAAATLHLLGEGGSNAGHGPLRDDVLGIVLGKAHAEASRIVAGLWQLPPDLQLVLAHHHDVCIQGYVHPTAAIVAVAERTIAEEAGRGQLPPAWDHTRDAAFIAARDALSLSPRLLEAVKKDTRNILAKLEKAV